MHKRCTRVRATHSFIPQIILLLAISGQAWAQAIPGKNVDMVGPTPPDSGSAGLVTMQQNEVAGVQSAWQPSVHYAAWNDYRFVYHPDGGDAVVGFGWSTDDGRSWQSMGHPGFSIDDPTDPSLPPGGADANLVYLPGLNTTTGESGGGVVLVNHKAFDRASDFAQIRTGVWYT